MRAFGADLLLLPSEGGRITADLFDRFKVEIQKLAAEPNTFYTDQMNNADAILGYTGIGEEILRQIEGPINVFCAAVGTAGMLMGVSRAFRHSGCGARIVALEPSNSPVLSTGKAGAHRVEGIGVGFWPPHLKRGEFHEIRAIDEAAARDMARRLAREEGILAGTSSALNVVAAVQVAQELGPGNIVVTVACDTGLKYLGSDPYQ
jgi:cysteine synthase A